MKKLFSILIALALLCCSCGSTKTPEGLAKGSIIITTDNLPRIYADENYDYIAKSFVAALLRTEDNTVLSDNTNLCSSSNELYNKLLNNECDIVIGVAPNEEKRRNNLKNHYCGTRCSYVFLQS